jgi:cytoskeletal protein CcmA (bactofilin family)
MLLKTKKENVRAIEEPLGVPEVPSLAASSTGKTVVGKQIVIEGGIQGREDLVIEGTVKGCIDLEKFHLTIGPNGNVESEIRAGNVTVSGRLRGNIHAIEKVTLTKSADFSGEIHAKRVSVEDGAYLKAIIDIERESQKKVESIAKVADLKASGMDHDPIYLKSEADKRK